MSESDTPTHDGARPVDPAADGATGRAGPPGERRGAAPAERDWDLDVFAMTNPALGSAVVWAFLRGAEEAGGTLELPLLFLPIPMALSDEVSRTIARGNRLTGFFGWLDRNPGVTAGLGERVRRTVPYTRSALLYGAQAGLLAAGPDGRFRPTASLREQRLARAGPAVRGVFPLARRLGQWVGEVGSTSNVLYALGLTVT